MSCLPQFGRRLIRARAADFPDTGWSRLHARMDIAKRFHRIHGYRPNLRAPCSFNEKIQWRKLYDRNPLFPVFCDKWRVREYVRQQVGAHVLNDIYFRTKQPHKIPVNELPATFVVKATHGCGWTLPCQNHHRPEFEQLRRQCRQWLATSYGAKDYEWGYRGIEPQIIVEEYVEDGTSGFVPPDYKLYVFNGRTRLIQVDFNRYSTPTKALFDEHWNYLDFQYNYAQSASVEPPRNLAEMRAIAETLARPVDFARVDLYQGIDGVRFGEITVYPNSGMVPFNPVDWDYRLGDWWTLPAIRSA